MARVVKTLKSSPTKQQQQSAGKQPTRIPMANLRRASPCTTDESAAHHSGFKAVVKVTKRKQAKQLKPEAPSTHRMKTRLQTKQASYFRIRDLPAEIRNQIYTLATVDEHALALEKFTIPPTLSVCRQIRAEALPIYFAANTFAASIRSNWCVRRMHWHRPDRKFYESTGVLNAAPVLSKFTPPNAPMQSLKAIARFRNVELTLGCACCPTEGSELAMFSLHVGGGKIRVDNKTLIVLRPIDIANLELIRDRVEARAENICKRGGFNGFSVAHIRELAECFLYKGKKAVTVVDKKDEGQSA